MSDFHLILAFFDDILADSNFPSAATVIEWEASSTARRIDHIHHRPFG